MTANLKERISAAKLTRKEAAIADFVLDNFDDCCFMTLSDISERLCVSNSSVIRFTRTLGFSGFTQFKEALRTEYTAAHCAQSDIPSQRLKISMQSGGNVMETHLSNVLGNINSVLSKNTPEAFEQASETLINSRCKFLVSSRANSGVGDMMLLWLKHMLPNVFLCSDSAINVIDHIADIRDDDCLLLISFPRYSQMDILAAQMAHDSGAKILLITDKPTSPIAHLATSLLTVSVSSNTFFNSYAGVVFLAETLCACISKRIGVSNQDKLEKIDKYISTLGVF